ncbi:MAG: ABC transporter transmembrane domain-containing protein, partial [Gammaproteobacteria bacterium]
MTGSATRGAVTMPPSGETDGNEDAADETSAADGGRAADEGQTVPSPQRKSSAILAALLPFLAPYRSRVVLAAVALLVAAGATLAMPLAFRQLIDLGFSSEALHTGGNVNRAFPALFAVAVVLALGTALRFYCVSWLGERVTADLRRAVYRQVLRQDARFFETLRTGEVLSRLSTDTTLIQTLIGTSVSLGLRNALLFVGGLAMLVVTSPKLALIIVGLLVLVVLPIL